MKALVYTQPNEMQILDRPHPSLDDGEVVLKIESVGICGSDMHAYHGNVESYSVSRCRMQTY